MDISASNIGSSIPSLLRAFDFDYVLQFSVNVIRRRRTYPNYPRGFHTPLPRNFAEEDTSASGLP